MNDATRNTRTLIISFVVAIMALVPLRFVEVGQQLGVEPQVLGDETVTLPDAGQPTEPTLEEPYRSIEEQAVLGETSSSSCIARADADTAIADFQSQIEKGDLTVDQINALVEQMTDVENNACK